MTEQGNTGMKKIALGIVAAALLAIPATASAGNAYGKEAQGCIVSSSNLGQALKNGREVHGALITPKSWVESGVHCG